MNIKKDEDKTSVQQETLDESAISDAKKSFEERDLTIDVEKNYVKDECREALLRFKTIHNPRYLIAQGMVPTLQSRVPLPLSSNSAIIVQTMIRYGGCNMISSHHA